MTDVREQGIQVFRELLPGVLPEGDVDVASATAFGGELFEIAVDNVFGRLWTREGLSRRDRSLVTLGMLIALRSSDELKIHVQIARNNGLTEDEIAEVIYHSSAVTRASPPPTPRASWPARCLTPSPDGERSTCSMADTGCSRHTSTRWLRWSTGFEPTGFWSHLGESNS